MKIHRFSWGQRDDAQAAIVHFQSKSTPLIAQLLRQIGLQSRICLPEEFGSLVAKGYRPKAVILSGGPAGVYEKDAPYISKKLLGKLQRESNTVIIGICYGAQLLAQLYGGKVAPASQSESGVTRLTVWVPLGSYAGGKVVMNHNDEVVKLPKSWLLLGRTDKCVNALFCFRYEIWGMQFHPEMDHTEGGGGLMRHVLYGVAGCSEDYRFSPAEFVSEAGRFIRKSAGSDNLAIGLSGGVDSATARELAIRAVGKDRVRSFFVDNGFMRENELEQVRGYFGDENVDYLDESERFYLAVSDVRYPGYDGPYYHAVRKVIGKEFIRVFKRQIRKYRNTNLLVQGTNVSDIIESQTGLKSHHNVGGLPEGMDLGIIEPLAGLYKFEIRQVAAYLGLSPEIVWRQPFPGPGNSIRTWGLVTPVKAKALARANRILEEVVAKHYPTHADRPCQYFVALMPLSTRGLVGDKGVDGYLWMLRAVSSAGRESYTTAEPFGFSAEFKKELSFRLTNEVKLGSVPFVGVTELFTGKPPATVEPH